jgi:hypothetical protein
MSFDIQWTRDGSDIGGATSNTYVVQAADRGHTLGFRLIARNAVGSTTATAPSVPIPAITLSGAPAASATVGVAYSFTPTASGGTAPYTYSLPSGTLPAGLSLNTSTGAITGTPTTAQTSTGLVLKVTDNVGATGQLSAFTITVANASGTAVTPATWRAALAAASPGTTLLMAAGDYGPMGIYGVSKAAPGVMLQGQAGVTCSYIDFGGAAGVGISGFTFTGLYNGQYGIYVESGCDRIVVDHMTTAGNNPGAVHSGVGIWCRGATNLTITNNTLANLADGIDGLDCSNVTIAGNHITKISDNFIFWSSLKNAVIEKNYLANFDFIDGGTHPDTIQIASTGATGRSSNITIRYNNYDAKTGVAAQGIAFVGDVDGVTITGNCTFGAQYNGCSVASSTNVTITDNFVQGWTYSPGILARGASDTVAMSGNWCANTPTTIEACTNVTIGSNTLIANATGSGDATLRNTWLAAHPLVPAA